MNANLLRIYLRQLGVLGLMQYANAGSTDDAFYYHDYCHRLATISAFKLATPHFVDMVFKDHTRAAVNIFGDELTEEHIQYVVDHAFELTKFLVHRLTVEQMESLYNSKRFFAHKHLHEHPYYQVLLSKRDETN